MNRRCSVFAKLTLGLVLSGVVVPAISWAQEAARADGAVDTAEPAAMRTATLRVLDAAGQPVTGASAAFQLGWPRTVRTDPTDESGQVAVELPADEPILAVVAWKDGLGLDYRSYSLSSRQQADALATAPAFPTAGTETLVLEGAVPLTVRVLDDKQQPLPEVRVYPWILQKESENTELNLSFFMDFFGQQTAPDGRVTFAWLPRWQTGLITLWPDADGFVHQRGTYDPATGSGEVELVLQRLVPIRGRVRHADGSPAPGITVAASGAGYTFDRGQATAVTDDAGAYELLVPPDQVYLVVVQHTEWAAAPQTGFAVLKGQPVEGKDFQLRPATRVQGRLVSEDAKEPIAEQYVHIYQYGQDLHSLSDVELPNPEKSRLWVQPLMTYHTKTDAQGRFEFLLGDGNFDIRPPQHDTADRFEIAGETELTFEVTAKNHREVELAGSVRDQATDQPLAGATIVGVPRSFTSVDWQATTNAEGQFLIKHRASLTYLYAVSQDRQLAAIASVDATQGAVTLHLEPVASATGRLISRETKEPWAGQTIQYAVQVPSEDNRTWSYRFGGSVTTGDDGTFQLAGLVGGQEYILYFDADENGYYRTLTKAKFLSGETTDLGDLEPPPPYQPYVPPTLEQRISQAFEVAGTPLERHAKALETVDLVKQHLLIVFGTPEDPRIHRLMEIRFEDPDYRPLSDEYRLMAIPTDEAHRDAAAELASLLEESLQGDRGDFLLVLLNDDGQKVATAGDAELCVDEALSKDRLLEWLRSHMPEPPEARVLLDEALARAKQEDKRVLVQETATWCGPCHMLARFLDANRMWEQDYIWVKMDHRWSGAQELMAELRDGADGGIPWFAILDAQGEKLATSNEPENKSNIGYPSSPAGQQHLENMLRTTRQRLSDEELSELIGKLAESEG